MVSWTVIATTGERFSGFAPYVASVNEAGAVAFQAALRDGGMGVFIGREGEIEDVAGPSLLTGVTSHPDTNEAGDTCFYGVRAGSGQGVFLVRAGRLHTIASTRDGFATIGPLGPTMNEAGAVAFRAERARGLGGIFVGDDAGVVTVAETDDVWAEFHGLPVVLQDGTVVFRADRKDGIEGIYAGDGESITTVVESGELFETLARFPSVADDGTVAFAATLRAGGAAIATVGDGGTAIVDADGSYESFRGALITGAAQIVRIATPAGGSLGLFAGPDPDADRILALDDPLLGSTVADFAANPVSVSAVGHLAVRATLADGKQVILRADRVG